MIEEKTIVAISSPIGYAAIGIVRLSGKYCLAILNKTLRIKSQKIQDKRVFYFDLFDTDIQKIIDSGIGVFYKAPKSYTGEDMAEIFLHGNPIILKRAVELFIKNGAELAGPGEFTKRAFFNNKIDLVQAENIASLIYSKSVKLAAVAFASIQGDLSKIFNRIKKSLIDILSLVYTDTEFSEDIEIDLNEIIKKTEELIKFLKENINKTRAAEFFNNNFNIVITGKTNAGKSTLFNSLIGTQRSIISEIPGTTRDFIDYDTLIEDIPIKIFDTAGIRKADDIIEKKGIERTKHITQQANLILFVVDSTSLLSEHELAELKEIHKKCLILFNKIDIVNIKEKLEVQLKQNNINYEIINISAKKNININLLLEKISQILKQDFDIGDNITVSLRAKLCLEDILKLLETARENIKNNSSELAAEDLKQSLEEIELFCGQTSNEDILNNIFSNFCIGK